MRRWMEFSDKSDAECMLDLCEQRPYELSYALEWVGGRWRLEIGSTVCGSIDLLELPTPAGAA